MKFGHYSNEELGIRRNLTCAMFENKGVSVEGDKKCALKTETLQMDYQDPVSSVVSWVCKNYPAIHNLKKAALALRDKTRLATVEDYDKYVTLSGKYIEALRKGIEVLRRKVDRDEIMPSNEALLKKGLDEAYASQLKRMSDLTKSSKGRWLKERQMSNELDEAEDVQCATNNAYDDAMDDICQDLRRSFNKNFRNIDEAIRYMYKDLITDTDWTEMFRNRTVTEDMILDFCFANGSSRAYDEKYTCERLTIDGYSKAEAKKATSKAYKDFEQKCKPYAKKVFALYKKLQNERQMSNEQDERELQCANTVKFGNGKYSPSTKPPRLGQKTSEKRRTAFYAEMTYQDMLTDIKNPQRAALKFKEWVHEYGSRYHINENSKPDDVVNAMVSYYCTNTTPDYSIGSTIGDAMRGKKVSLSELGVTREERDEFNRTVAKWRATAAKVWSDYVSQSDKKMSNEIDSGNKELQCSKGDEDLRVHTLFKKYVQSKRLSSAENDELEAMLRKSPTARKQIDIKTLNEGWAGEDNLLYAMLKSLKAKGMRLTPQEDGFVNDYERGLETARADSMAGDVRLTRSKKTK